MNMRRLAVAAAAILALVGVGAGVGMVAELRSEVVELREQVNRQSQPLRPPPPPPTPPPAWEPSFFDSDDSAELEELRDQVEDLEQELNEQPPPTPRIIRPEPHFDANEWLEKKRQEERIERLEKCQKYGGFYCY